jgi:hypothetical protein
MTLARRPEFPVIAAALSTFMRQMADFVVDFAGGDSALAAEYLPLKVFHRFGRSSAG